MIGEQTTICRYSMADPQVTDIEIQMTVQIQIPDDDPYGNLGIELSYERIFPEEMEDVLHQRLRNGVHGGIALSNTPLFPPNLVVRLLDLQVSPLPQTSAGEQYKTNLGYLLEASISGVVDTLLRSLENLHSGSESYYEG